MANAKTIAESWADLEAQKAALKKAEKELKAREAAFLAEADARKAFLLERWGIAQEKDQKQNTAVLERLRGILEAYGCDAKTFFDHVGSEKQITYFKMTRKN